VIGFLLIGGVLVLGLNFWSGAQDTYNTKGTITIAQLQAEQQKAKTKPSGTEASATLTATLVDPDKKAQQKAATVQVKVAGIKLTDPATVNEQPKKGQGHIHYQVDDGPVIATTTTKLSFHNLSSGEHKIVVKLAANDHSPLGPEETLKLKVP
jgi:hypothetical protein